MSNWNKDLPDYLRANNWAPDIEAHNRHLTAIARANNGKGFPVALMGVSPRVITKTNKTRHR